MKRKSIYWMGALLLSFAMAACKDDPKPGTEPEPVPPLPELAQPKDLVVSVKMARMAVVEWVGDATATSYQVEVSGRQIELEGTSCGMNLREETDYTWRVRAVRGDETTEWVTGPTFRTPEYNDPRNPWLGYWNVGEWNIAADVSGMEIPLDDLMEALPPDLISELLDAASFKFTTPEEIGEVSIYDELLITFDLLSELGIPGGIASIYLDDEMYRLDEYVSIPLDYPGTPLLISEIPFLGNVPGLGELEDALVTKLQLELNELQLAVGPVAGDAMPFTAKLSGRLIVETDDDLINIAIGMLGIRLNLTLTSTVERVPVTPV